MSIGVAVLEFVAECVLPTLVNEVSTSTVHEAARQVARGVHERNGAASAASRAALHAMTASAVLSQMPGRARLKVLGLQGNYPRARLLARRLEQLPGVRAVSVSALTGNALVEYDPARIHLAQIRTVLEPRPARSRRRADRSAVSNVRQLTLVGV